MRFAAMATSANPATIDEVLGRFLAEQRERLSDKTFRRYEEVVQLLRHSLDGDMRTARWMTASDDARRWSSRPTTKGRSAAYSRDSSRQRS